MEHDNTEQQLRHQSSVSSSAVMYLARSLFQNDPALIPEMPHLPMQWVVYAKPEAEPFHPIAGKSS